MKKIKTVLLVEDNLLDAELAMEGLKSPNAALNIIHLLDGSEALDYLYSKGVYANKSVQLPDLIFLDLKMPKVDGLEVLEVVKSDKNLSTIPIIMLTSSREEQDLIKSYKLGVNAYIVKPVDLQKFNEAIRSTGEFWGLFNETPSIRRP